MDEISIVKAQIQEVKAKIQTIDDVISNAALKFQLSLEAGKENLADYWRKKDEDSRKEKDQLHEEKKLLLENLNLLVKERLLEKENRGISPVELRKCLSSLVLDVGRLASERSRTRSASTMPVPDFKSLRRSLDVTTLYEDIDGKQVRPEVLENLLGEKKFWSSLYERQQKAEYIAEVNSWVPEALEEEEGILWKDVDGHTVKTMFSNAPFPVSAQNDQLAFVKGMDFEEGALLGLELKRKVLSWKALRQAEVEFYVWGNCSMFPFVQVITDMQKGGVAMYCKNRSSNLVLVHVALRTMDEVKRFTQMVLSNPPKADNASYREVTVSEGLQPPRKRFRTLQQLSERTERTETEGSSDSS